MHQNPYTVGQQAKVRSGSGKAVRNTVVSVICVLVIAGVGVSVYLQVRGKPAPEIESVYNPAAMPGYDAYLAALNRYTIEVTTYREPPTLPQLYAFSPGLQDELAAWGHGPYYLREPEPDEGTMPILMSMGPDGVQGTADDYDPRERVLAQRSERLRTATGELSALVYAMTALQAEFTKEALDAYLAAGLAAPSFTDSLEPGYIDVATDGWGLYFRVERQGGEYQLWSAGRDMVQNTADGLLADPPSEELKRMVLLEQEALRAEEQGDPL